MWITGLIILSTSFAQGFQQGGRRPLPLQRLRMLKGQAMPTDSKSNWDLHYSKKKFVYGKAPARFLAQNYQYLPPQGRVLDMGMGEGRNAVFLAQKGFKVTGIDISSIAVRKSKILAKENGVRFKAITGSLDNYEFGPESFDAIISFYYVNRALVEKMLGWIRKGGVIIFEAYTTEQRERVRDSGPIEGYLRPQELLKLFPGTRVLKFEEPQHNKDFRSSLIVQKVK